jgi:hypothetical protein
LAKSLENEQNVIAETVGGKNALQLGATRGKLSVRFGA